MEGSNADKVKSESKSTIVKLKLRKDKKLPKVKADIPPDEEIVPEEEVVPDDKPEKDVVPDDKPEEEVVPEDKPEEDVVPDEEVVPDDKPEEEVVPEDKPEEEVTSEDDLQPDDQITPEDELDPECEQDTDSDSDSDSSSSSSSSDSDSDHECTVCNRKISGYASYKQHLKGKKHAKAVAKRQIQKKLARKGEYSKTMATEADDEYSNLQDYLTKQEPYAVCKTCDKEFGGPESYAMHLKSKTHKNKVVEALVLEQVLENGEINPEKLRELQKKSKGTTDVVETLRPKDGDEEFECKQCDKEFTGLTPYLQHLSSKTHAKQMEKMRLLHEVVPETEDSSGSNFSALTVEDDVLVCKACTTSFSGPENAMNHLKSKKHGKKLDKYLRSKKYAKTLEKSDRKLKKRSGKEPKSTELVEKKNVRDVEFGAVASSSKD